MAWNGSGGTAQVPARKGGKPSALRGLAAGAAIVVVVAVFVCFMLADKVNRADSPAGKKSSLIKEVEPAKVSKAEDSFAVKRPYAKPKTTEEAFANLAERRQPTPITKKKPIVDLSEYTNRVFTTATEQVMSWIFTTRVGEMPFPMPGIPPEEKKNIVAILISKNEVKDGDSEVVAEAKDAVALAKKEMISYIKEGGDPEEFLSYYNKELERMYYLRCDARNEYCKLFDEDSEMAEEFRKKVNDELAKEGAQPIERQFATLEEELEHEEAEKEKQEKENRK